MVSREYLENSAAEVGRLDRDELVRRIQTFKGRFKLDFTNDYLNKLPVDRLRHLYFAALINAGPDYKESRE